MSKRSAAASAAAHAASKKNSAVELTAGDEERARQALQVIPAHASSGALALHSTDVDAKRCVVQQLDLLVGPTQPQVSSSWDKDELVSQLSDLCDTLLAESFRWQDIQQALQVAQHTASCLFVAHSASAYPQGVSVLQAVPMEQMSEATVLDWLCLNVDPAYLPRRFDCTLATDVMASAASTYCFKTHCCRYAGGVQSRAAASGIRLVAKAKGKPKAAARVAVPIISPEEEAQQRKAKQLEEQARQQKAAEAAAAAAAKEKDAQRQWILQYAEDDSESESDDHNAEQVS